MTVIDLLNCAISNLSEPTLLGNMIAKAQIKQYKELKKAGANDEDDVNKALELYPECSLKMDFNTLK